MGLISDSTYSKASVGSIDPHLNIPGVLQAEHQKWWGCEDHTVLGWGLAETRAEEALNPSANQTMS